MPRKLVQTKEVNQELEELIPKYATAKQDADNLKKVADKLNGEIKSVMGAQKLDKYSTGGYKVSYVVQHRDTMNEDKLIQIAHLCGLSKIIKTKEYIDFEALENEIYHGNVSGDVLSKINECKETKEVVTLRITKEGK